MTHKPHKPPEQVNGFRRGDRVITPLGRRATVVAIRVDGYIDATYDDWPPTLAAVILQADKLRHA